MYVCVSVLEGLHKIPMASLIKHVIYGSENRISRSQIRTPSKPHSLELFHGHML